MYTDQDIANLVARVQQLEMQAATRQVAGTPNIKMLSPNFLTRAFAVCTAEGGNSRMAAVMAT